MNDNSYKVIEVDINEILPNRFQPRIKFDETEILELSDSIKEHGVIQPLVVRTIGDKYEIIAGERRYKASVLAGKETVPVIIKNLNDKDSAEVALIENIQRKNLTPIEEALSYKKILDMGYITQEALAVKLGKSQSSVANKVRLLNLSDEVQEALLDNKISERHARSLLRLKSIKEQNKMLEKIVSERLTVRKTDDEIDKILKSKKEEKNIEDEKEIIRKGEFNMNNEMNQIPNIVTPNPTNTFDIFGGIQPSSPTVQSAPVMPSMPEVPVSMQSMTVEPIPTIESTPVLSAEPQSVPVMPEIPTQPIGGIQFDANNNVLPVGLNIEEDEGDGGNSIPLINSDLPNFSTLSAEPQSMPVMPEIPTQSMGEIQFDLNSNVIAPTTEMVVPEVPVSMQPMTVETIPTIEPTSVLSAEPQSVPVMPEISTQPIGGIQFDANNNVISKGEEVTPVISTPMIEPTIPVTSPIIESIPEITPISATTMSLNEIQNTPVVEPTTVASEIPPVAEPIIITDYNKQYDPVMPTAVETPVAIVDFKEIINTIRECSSKIEQYGYKIDVEEYDLSSIYQVVIKIEK